MRRAPPAEDTASAQKAPRSKNFAAPRQKIFRAPQESRMRLPSETLICGCGGIGRRTSLRSWRFSVQVQVLSPAPKYLVLWNEVFLSIAKAMVYHQLAKRVVSHQSVRTVYHYALAFIQNAFAMMICDSCGIDDIQRLTV